MKSNKHVIADALFFIHSLDKRVATPELRRFMRAGVVKRTTHYLIALHDLSFAEAFQVSCEAFTQFISKKNSDDAWLDISKSTSLYAAIREPASGSTFFLTVSEILDALRLANKQKLH